MTYDITIAAFADWLPKFDPPFGENGFAMPYRDRLKLQLPVEPADTLASVYQRALELWRPHVSADSPASSESLMNVIHWVWFYLPEDEPHFADRYESARDLILLDGAGLAEWNLGIEEIPYGDLVRAADAGLLRGDQLRP
jgi:hypothetical protein